MGVLLMDNISINSQFIDLQQKSEIDAVLGIEDLGGAVFDNIDIDYSGNKTCEDQFSCSNNTTGNDIQFDAEYQDNDEIETIIDDVLGGMLENGLITEKEVDDLREHLEGTFNELLN
jgi:hypothetical protein